MIDMQKQVKQRLSKVPVRFPFSIFPILDLEQYQEFCPQGDAMRHLRHRQAFLSRRNKAKQRQRYRI